MFQYTLKYSVKQIFYCFSDGLKSVQTEDDAMNDYLRLLQVNQMDDQLYTNGISYTAFTQGGYHIVGYDMSTSLDGGSQSLVTPSVRVGNIYFFISKTNCLH